MSHKNETTSVNLISEHASHLPTVSGEQTCGQYLYKCTIPLCSKIPKVTSVCQIYHSWECDFKKQVLVYVNRIDQANGQPI